MRGSFRSETLRRSFRGQAAASADGRRPWIDGDDGSSIEATLRAQFEKANAPLVRLCFNRCGSTSSGWAVTGCTSGLLSEGRLSPRQMLAARVVEHLEQSGFGIDEAEQVMRKRPPSANHG